ncbi:MAG TPA: cytochrome b/b6 domain-containing protein [Syntrophorhabdales bacterium]|nr:cytochrome b/b6 domain-containing protein [Syntrophorhabdales bacterium]
MTRVKLYTLPIRIWHWINALLIFLLILTGAQLRVPGLPFFGHYSKAVWLHKYMGFCMVGSFIFWLVYVLFSGSLRSHYLMRIRDVRGMVRQAMFYMYGIFRGGINPFVPSPENKFNPMQKMAYFTVMVFFTPAILVTGILFSDILYFAPYINALGGLRILDALHVVFAYIFLLYLAIHLYMATLGHTILAHTKAMILGYEEEEGGESTEGGEVGRETEEEAIT